MLTIASILTVCAGASGGGLVGGAIAWWYARSRRQDGFVVPAVCIDPTLEQQCDDAAAQWAAAHGQPSAAPLIANKLKLAQILRSQHRSGRWSR
jgi:hypothetical protein